MQTDGGELMADFKLEIDSNLDDKIRHLPEAISPCLEAAQKIAAIARQNAPVVTGRYLAGIQVQQTRAGARVFASDQKSALIEFGVPSRGQAAKFVLRRAVEAAGYKFKKR